jgi:hypothetical protein
MENEVAYTIKNSSDGWSVSWTSGTTVSVSIPQAWANLPLKSLVSKLDAIRCSVDCALLDCIEEVNGEERANENDNETETETDSSGQR